jgi:hypothetical protein
MGAKVFWIAGPWRGRLGIVPRPRGAEWLDLETRAWREAGVRSFPIPDRSVPTSREAVARLVDDIVGALQAGKNVALHCRQGVGRSAMIAAAALVSGGQNAETAIKTIRLSRGLDIPETRAQRQWVSDFSSWVSNRRAAQLRHAAGGAPRRS